MKISAADQANYPNFTKYVQIAFPKLINFPNIVSNASTYGNLTRNEFQHAITWGNPPNILIIDLHHGQCGVPRAYGCFDPSRAVNIEIHSGVVTDFEAANASHKDTNSSGKPVYVAGATILHELCHWGNSNNVPRVPELIEMGAEFEKNTYGKIIY